MRRLPVVPSVSGPTRRHRTVPKSRSYCTLRLRGGLVQGLLERVDILLEFGAMPARPRVRADCLPGGSNAARPCPWVGCQYHLYLDVEEQIGSIRWIRPDLQPWQMRPTCALDVADRGAHSLDTVGRVFNVTREAIRIVQEAALKKIKQHLSPAVFVLWEEGMKKAQGNWW